MARWAATAASTAPVAVGKTTKNESPSVRISAANRRPPLLDEADEEFRTPPFGVVLIEVRLEPLSRVLADGLEHRESRPLLEFLPPNQAVVEQGSEALERFHPEVLPRVAHGVDCRERAAARERREPGEQSPLGLVQELIAPLDRRSERSLT